MTYKEYLQAAEKWDINQALVSRVEQAYTMELPKILQQIVSHADDPVFFDDGTHVFSYSEILDAENTLDVAFREKGLIPIVDYYDGNYVVYNCNGHDWAIYSAIDDLSFKRRPTLAEVLF